MIVALRELEHVSFRLLHPETKQTERDQRETELQMLMATISQTSDAYKKAEAELQAIKDTKEWFYKGNDGAVHGPFPTNTMLAWHNSYPDRFGRDLLVRLADEEDFHSIGDRFGDDRPFDTSNACCVSAGTGCHRISLVSGANGRFEQVVIELTVPAWLFKLLPEHVQSGDEVEVHPVLWTMGVNEMQSIANMKASSDVAIQGVGLEFVPPNTDVVLLLCLCSFIVYLAPLDTCFIARQSN